MKATHPIRALRALPLLFLAVLLGLARTAAADDARAQFRLDGGSPHVDVPFRLDLVVEGFDEGPAPELPKLDIANATVTPVGAQPNVSRSIQIINGRRSDSTRVSWVLSWQVSVHKDGTMHVPATTVTQGSKHATAAAGEAEVDTVPMSDDMKLELKLPERPVFVGETVPVTMTWLFRRQPQDQTFSVPLLSSDSFTVSGPPVTNPRQALTLSAGGKDLQLPYTLDQTSVGGVDYNRLVVTMFAAPRKAGKVEVPPASVVAALAVGRADFFGNAPTRMFRAVDAPHTLEVKPLPETDRPATFAGAVGDQFSIDVRTSRSVVQLGEPMELDITIKSDQPLDTLALGKMDGEGRLPRDTFTVPADPPTGELSDQGKTKTFKVTAQVTGPAREVPALAFSYFDAAKGHYQTIKSEPIALSVKGGTFVGAGDVVSGAPTKRGGTAAATTTPGSDDAALVNAELALSSAGAADDRPLRGGPLWILVGLLYAVPLALLLGRSYQLRTRGQREEAGEVKQARKKVEQLLDRAAEAPAREIAGPLGAALRDLARVLGQTTEGSTLLARLETESFAPSAASVPLSSDLRSDAAGLMRRWMIDARKGTPKVAKATIVSLALLVALAPRPAAASPLEDGRLAYQQAMEMTANASGRRAAFARAQVALGEAVRATPDRPELLADWGNAALGAGDVATATLAYRRALALDASNTRARHNLAWLRSRAGDTFRPASAGATDTLLFFHSWSRARKLLVGAAAFAIAVLLLVPWAGRRRRGFTGLAILPFAVWLVMMLSVVLASTHADDAVVMDDVILRAADSAGAPAALSQPLPRGAEVTLLERRDAWMKIRIANGTAGWVPAGSVERVSPPE